MKRFVVVAFVLVLALWLMAQSCANKAATVKPTEDGGVINVTAVAPVAPAPAPATAPASVPATAPAAAPAPAPAPAPAVVPAPVTAKDVPVTPAPAAASATATHKPEAAPVKKEAPAKK